MLYVESREKKKMKQLCPRVSAMHKIPLNVIVFTTMNSTRDDKMTMEDHERGADRYSKNPRTLSRIDQ